jgi:hypothetical protein
MTEPTNPNDPHCELLEVLISKDGIVARKQRTVANDMVQHLGWKFEQTANLPRAE